MTEHSYKNSSLQLLSQRPKSFALSRAGRPSPLFVKSTAQTALAKNSQTMKNSSKSQQDLFKDTASITKTVLLVKKEHSNNTSGTPNNKNSLPCTPQNQIITSHVDATPAQKPTEQNTDYKNSDSLSSNDQQFGTPSQQSFTCSYNSSFSNSSSNGSTATSDEEDYESTQNTASPTTSTATFTTSSSTKQPCFWTKEEDKVLMSTLHAAISNPLKSPVLFQGKTKLPYGMVHRVVRDTVKIASKQTGKPFLHSLADTRKRLHYLYLFENKGTSLPSNMSSSSLTANTQEDSTKPAALARRETYRRKTLLSEQMLGKNGQNSCGFDFSEDNRMQNVGPLSQPFSVATTTTTTTTNIERNDLPQFVTTDRASRSAQHESVAKSAVGLRSTWIHRKTCYKNNYRQLIDQESLQRHRSDSSLGSNISGSSEKRALLDKTSKPKPNQNGNGSKCDEKSTFNSQIEDNHTREQYTPLQQRLNLHRKNSYLRRQEFYLNDDSEEKGETEFARAMATLYISGRGYPDKFKPRESNESTKPNISSELNE